MRNDVHAESAALEATVAWTAFQQNKTSALLLSCLSHHFYLSLLRYTFAVRTHLFQVQIWNWQLVELRLPGESRLLRLQCW